ncbi:hypothetical protein PGLA_22755 [Paenibacillus glacialis]|uniref:DUF4329 domain-containing protein n=2 Tax=Paenibacillus glacialis TaxID=494026 RepID=A0A168DNQ6_9BACL|nr:hypothetical protein PGLA_22755 [Paenibacillus glacialis]
MDADGNLLYMSEGKTMASFEYDARNRLVKSGKAQYTYDAQGNRTSMTWKGKTTRYVVDALPELSRVLMELDAEGTPKTYYVYGLGLIGREDAQGHYQSYHSDIRGSTTLLTDEQGSVTDRYTYGPYGELEKHEGKTNQPFGYNGRDGVQSDPNGLYYMRARYYHPVLQRFLNRDILRGDLMDGQTLNRYAYVNGDPIRYIDPLGLMKGPCPDGVPEGTGNLAEEGSQLTRRILPDGRVVSDVTSLPGKQGITVPNRVSPEEMRQLTEHHGVQFALVYERGTGKNGAGGTYNLFSGTSTSVPVPISKDSMLIYHTHPAGSPFSSKADRRVLQVLEQVGSPQRSSQIIPSGRDDVIRFFQDGSYR